VEERLEFEMAEKFATEEGSRFQSRGLFFLERFMLDTEKLERR
jgi:hypothetical protein